MKKPDYTAIQQHYEIREDRYRQQIQSLRDMINDKDVQIAELNLQIKRLQLDNKRMYEQLRRVSLYTDNSLLGDFYTNDKKSQGGLFRRFRRKFK